MARATATCNFCDYTDGFTAPDGDVDAMIAGAKALRERLIAHTEAKHPDEAPPEPLEAPPAELRVWCFTFGCGSPLSRYYVEIEGRDELQARSRIIALFSRHWAGVYPREGFDRQIRDYGLQRLDVNKSGSVRLGTNHDELSPDLYRQAFPW